MAVSEKKTEVTIEVNPIEAALTAAVVKVIGAVASGAASGSTQATSGAQGTAGGAAAEAGLSSQAVSGEVNNKIDVSAPEVIESFNVQALKDAVIANKMMVDSYGARLASNLKLYDATATAISLAALGTTHNMTLQQQMASDHRDQNHDKQINIDEQIAAALILYGRLGSVSLNPVPPEK
jgi:hypothetical protein